MKYPIDYKEKVLLGGLKQTIHIWGTKEENPVVLFLHGGPGIPNRYTMLERNADLLVFVWAWVSVCDPEISDILRVKAEIVNVCESLAAGNLTLDMINRQLMDEFGLATDWARRDRG